VNGGNWIKDIRADPNNKLLAIKENIVQFDIDVDSKYKELFLETRAFLLKYGLIETKKDRITTYSDKNGGICHMRTMPHGIDIGFLKGARMEDPFDLLTGSGKVMRVLPVSSINKEKIKYYLNQALVINEK
jgi:hypothetical protein